MGKVRRASVRRGGEVYGVILAGGSGSRFWPVSRQSLPKQLINVLGEDSLLKSTIRRLTPLIPPERMRVVTNERLAETVRLHLLSGRDEGLPGIISEPEGKNTAPAVALAAHMIAERDPEATVAVFPADLFIEKEGELRAALGAGIEAAWDGGLVTFGVRPTSPETSYGYIRAGGSLRRLGGYELRSVGGFVEKPDPKMARAFIKDRRYLWNSGVFVWKAKSILEEIGAVLPGFCRALSGGADGIRSAYESVEDISIERAVLERSRRLTVIPVDFSWADIGCWSSFASVMGGDSSGNTIKGRVVDIGSRGSMILGGERALATVGLKDVIVVDTVDATLICAKERAAEVSEAVKALKSRGFDEHDCHRTVARPWGSYTLLEKGACYKIKKITVDPGRRLSLQLHRKRSEHWVVISGTARVQRGDEVVDIRPNESTYIPRGVAHRLENPGSSPLELIEVQNGEYVEEDDITRLDDDYERS